MKKNYIGVDFGASNGKLMVGNYDGKRISIEELHRFDNRPVFLHGVLYWDFLSLFSELKFGIKKAINKYGDNISKIGIDTWGVDFGLIDKQGKLLSNPVSYRDRRTLGMIDEVDKIIPKKDLFMNSGEFIMEINTIFQLYYLVKTNSPSLKITDKLLMIPDLFNYFLTGEKFCEFTEAVTTSLIDQKKHKWLDSIISRLNIPNNIFPEIIYPGEVVGKTTKQIGEELSISSLDVIATGSHDAASAVAGLPVNINNSRKKWAFIIIGTWSAVGVELINKPLINNKTYELGFSNEGGVLNRYSFQKIISGLWLLQELKDYWSKKENKNIDWNDIVSSAEQSESFVNFIDVDDPIFLSKTNNIIDILVSYYRKTKQNININKGNISRSVYEGLVFKYKKAIFDIEKITNNKIELIFLTGGGSNNKSLCQWIANALNIITVSGIAETTTIGNILMQLKADREIENIDEGRQIVSDSFNLEYFKPKTNTDWNFGYMKYLETLKL